MCKKEAVIITIHHSLWSDIPIHDNGEKLISLKELNHSQIKVEPLYFLRELRGSINDCYAREGVADLLIKATKYLPKGYSFVVWDGWRPISVQQHLYDDFYIYIREKHPEWNHAQIVAEVKNYVSIPSMEVKKPSPHLTGGSIDLSILNNYGQLLNMGTDFDDFSEKTTTNYYEENHLKGEELSNRSLLVNSLLSVGFSNYEYEWWHFDYGNQFWAKRANRSYANYGLIFV